MPPKLSNNPIALLDLCFHWFLWPVASIVTRGRGYCLCCILSSTSFSDHRPCLGPISGATILFIAEHHGRENVVNYPSEKIWQSRDRTPTDRPSAPQVYQRKISGTLWWGFFGTKTNRNPRFVNLEDFIVMKSGAPLLGLAKSIYYLRNAEVLSHQTSQSSWFFIHLKKSLKVRF